MNARTRSGRNRRTTPRKSLARLGAGLERLEDRWLLAADGLAVPATALDPFIPSGPRFSSNYVDLPVPAAQASYEPVVSGGYTPQQLRHAYGLDQTLDGHSLDGSGQTIAIIALGDDPYIGTELANFDAAAGLPNPQFLKVTQPEPNGAPEPVDPGAAAETALDVEWAHAMAPGAAIELVEGNPDDYAQYPGQQLPAAVAFLNAVAYATHDPNVSVVTMSYGWTETDFTQYGFQVPDGYFVTPPGHRGITFIAASGDRDVAHHHYLPTDVTGRFPAESPNVVGVGATVAVVDGQGDWLSESADPISGGGYAQEAEPVYQRSSGTGDSLGARMSPDVSWTDSAIWIYSMYAQHGPWVQVVGTSASAPQFAGFMAEVDQGRALIGETTLDGPSQTLPLLYLLQDSFHDVRQFADAQDGGSPAFSPTPGYDLVTGLGTPVAGLLMPQLIAGGYLGLNMTGGAAIDAMPGQSVNQELATFSDPNGAMDPSRYTATIEWGDGSYSIDTVRTDANGKLAVFGNHAYPQAGQYTITVIVGSQRRNAVVEGETLDSAAVQSPSLAATGGFSLTATAGIGISNQVVATFHDPLDTGGYSANVEFGDGSSAPGTISAQGGGNYEVLASHTYDSGLTNGTITVVITRTSDSDSATVSGAVTVAPAPVGGGGGGGDAGGGDSGGNVGGEQRPSNLGELASQLANSAEAYSDFVFTAYEHYLGRQPDGPGISHWVSLMQQGLTDEQLEANFLAAPEYVADHGGSDVNWVIGMYHDLLGRAADGQGLAYWAGQIGSGVPEYNIALGFAASAEREAAVVQADYSKYLLRGATPEDIDYWVNQFLHGARNEDVIAGFVGSQEYYANPTKGNADRRAWLDRAFDDLYNRLPSDAELSQWLAEMD